MEQNAATLHPTRAPTTRIEGDNRIILITLFSLMGVLVLIALIRYGRMLVNKIKLMLNPVGKDTTQSSEDDSIYCPADVSIGNDKDKNKIERTYEEERIKLWEERTKELIALYKEYFPQAGPDYEKLVEHIEAHFTFVDIVEQIRKVNPNVIFPPRWLEDIENGFETGMKPAFVKISSERIEEP